MLLSVWYSVKNILPKEPLFVFFMCPISFYNEPRERKGRLTNLCLVGGDFFAIMNFRFCISQRCVYRAKGEEEIVRSGSVLPSGKERCLGVIWGGMGVRRERTDRFGAGGYGERGATSPLKRR